VLEYIRKARKRKDPESENQEIQQRKAEESFKLCTESFPREVPCVRISTAQGSSSLVSCFKSDFQHTCVDHLQTRLELVAVTRTSLRDVEGKLWLPWAAAQQISSRQKVDQSIRCVSTQHRQAFSTDNFSLGRAAKVRSSVDGLESRRVLILVQNIGSIWGRTRRSRARN
jgi:hypothetical protein